MATSLQQQLAAISAKSTNQLDLKAQRAQHSKSLLFEPKDAANQTLDTIYQICVEGFQELYMLDARFAPFAQNLFSEQSRVEDRTQMTAQENEQLDKVIQSFLGLVSGRLLLKPGQKAVEWLVRRFRAHEYNTDYLILTFLPYHANPIFATLLSIIPKQLSSAFRFLTPYASSLTSPPRHAVVYNAINNPGFFSSLNAYTLNTARQRHQSANLLGFWASVVAQAVNGQLDSAQSGRADVRRQREEDLLLRLIPLLQDALAIRNVPELYLGSCMVITILVTKTRLEDKVLNGLMEAVAQTWSAQTVNDGLACLSVISEERQAMTLTRTCGRTLIKMPDIASRLLDLSQRYQVGRLFMGIALHALDERTRQRNPSYLELVDAFLNQGSISNDKKQPVVRALLRSIAQQSSGATPEDEPATAASLQKLCGAEGALLRAALIAEQLKLETIEARLQIALSIPDEDSLVPISDVEDVEMGDSIEQDGTSMVEEATAALPNDLPPDFSFTAASNHDAESFLRAFAVIIKSKTSPETLLTHPALRRQEAFSHVPFFSFLARIWSGRELASVRLSALRAATDMLRSMSSENADMQAIMSYALTAMSDRSDVIRRAAAELLVQIESIYRASSKNAKASSNIKPWAQHSFYGANTKDIKWLSQTDAHKVVSSITPNLEECVLDASQMSQLLIKIIDASDEDLELKSSIRSAFCMFLCSHAVTTPSLNVRAILLSTLSRTGKTGSTGRTHVIVPALRSWMHLDEAARTSQCAAYGLQAADLDRAYVDCISSRTSEELECLKSLAKGKDTSTPGVLPLVYGRIRRLWPSMKTNAQQALAALLLDLALETGNDPSTEVRQIEALDSLRSVALPTEALISLLNTVPDIAQMSEKQPAAKRRRTSRSEEKKTQGINTVDLQQAIRRLTLILELIEGSMPERHPDLLKGLFNALSELQHYKNQLGSDLVYLQQMVIGSLLSIVESLKSNPSVKVDRSTLRTDLIVECVRSTSSTQVHNAALLLISSLAGWAPDLVLHSVMPIFTFMSTTILRQSDDYSAHVIDQTVSRVVPPLVKSLRKKNQDLVTGAAELLLSFTAAFEHIPMHRRLRLFGHLVEALGTDESLPAVLAMLFEKYPTDRRVPQFASELSSQFSPVTQLKAATSYLDLVADALQPKRTVSEAVFVFNDKSTDQIEVSIRHLLLSLANLLQQQRLHTQMLKVLNGASVDASSIELASAALLERSLGLAKTVEKRTRLAASCGTLVAACLGLLPTPHFVRSALPLLERPDDRLGLMILQSFEQRSEGAKSSDKETRLAMLEALPKVAEVVEGPADARLKHTAITCIDHIAEKYGKKDPSVVSSAASIVISDSALGHSSIEIRIISLLCLSTLVEVLRDDMVPLIPEAMEKAVLYLSDAVDDPVNARLHDAAYAFINSVLEFLPWSFSTKHTRRVLELSCEAADEEGLGGTSGEIRKQFYLLASRNVDTKALLQAINDTFEPAIAVGPQGCQELLSILHRVVSAQTKPKLLQNASPLFSALQLAFDMRRLLSADEDSPDEDELSSLDKARDAIMLESVMKLNDTTLRPFFVRLVDWTFEDLPQKNAEGRMLRGVSFFGFLHRFFESLKSIVTSYSSYIIDHSASVLKTTEPTGEDEKLLLKSALEALSSTFKHDQEDFWQSPNHFNIISTALLAQLTLSKSPALLSTLPVIPAVTELATAASSPDHHKELNAALLKLMRSSDAEVRLAAVKCEQNLTERLGEDWLALLPEMLPFISELQEDDDEVVEREALKWIRMIEGVLGESLEGMLQ